MNQINSPDELFEIRPDTDEIPEEDSDMIINESVTASSETDDTENGASETEAVLPAETETEEKAPKTEEKPAKAAETPDIEPSQTEALEEAESDDFSAEFEEIEREEQDMQMLEEIGDSIVQQVDAEIESSIITLPEEQTVAASEYGNVDDFADNGPEEHDTGHRGFFARIPWWGYSVAGVVIVIALTIVWIAATKSGRSTMVKYGSQYAANQVTYQPVAPVEQVDVPDETEDNDPAVNTEDIEVIPDDYTVITPEPVAPTPEVEPVEEDNTATPAEEIKNVYNVLLVGEENIDSGNYRGRPDNDCLDKYQTEIRQAFFNHEGQPRGNPGISRQQNQCRLCHRRSFAPVRYPEDEPWNRY